ncbi:RfaG Glycosyltransferase [Candidatus Nanopelagicaceae bacterium]
MIILHTITRGFGGGTMKALDQSIQYERSLGHVVWVCSGTMRPFDSSYIHISSLRREISFLSDLRAFFELRSVIRRINPDVIHSHESKAGVLTRLMSPMFKSAVFVHTVHMATFHSHRNSLIERIYSLIEEKMAKRTDVLLFVSSGLQNIYALRNIRPKSLAMTIHSRISIDSFRNRIPNKFEDEEYVKSELDIPASSKIILCVGLLEPRKRPALVLEQLSDILKVEESYNLLYLGEGPLQEVLEESVKKLGLSHKVHFAGFKEDIERWVSASDILVLASKFEGFPQIALQAASLGIPTVAVRLEEYGSTRLMRFIEEGEAMASQVKSLIESGDRLTEIDSQDELLNWNTQSIDACHSELLETLAQLRRIKP